VKTDSGHPLGKSTPEAIEAVRKNKLQTPRRVGQRQDETGMEPMADRKERTKPWQRIAMRRSLILCLLVCSAPVGANEMARFFYPLNDGGPLTCNGQPAIGTGPNMDQVPFMCTFSNSGELVIGLENWGWEGTATLALTDTEPEPTVTGFCAGSVRRDENNLTEYQYQLTPVCLPKDEPPRAATGELLVDEWYTDLPWHQKLSTLDSNLIDVPFVLPYEALSTTYQDKCQSAGEDKARCMLRYGIVDVMGVHRTDRVYKPGEALTLNDCQSERPCVEVKLDIQRFHTQTDDPAGYEADEIRNNGVWYSLEDNRVFYQNPNSPDPNTKKYPSIPSLGFGFTEATIFAPWRNWYTGHYCARRTDSIITSVCYDDYFTTQLVAAIGENQNWLRDGPAMFWPRGTEPGFEKYCASGEDTCAMYLGKVDWLADASKWSLAGCWEPGDPMREDLGMLCDMQLEENTRYLTDNFFASLAEFEDVGRYPWSEGSIPLPFDQEHNPFIGFYELQPSIRENASTLLFKSPNYVLPKECTKEDYRSARQGQAAGIARLRECAVNFEIHTSGFHEIWRSLYSDDGTLPLSDAAILDITRAIKGLSANQYGRTMFLYAGVPEQHVAVSFDSLEDAVSIHDKVYGGSLYIQYLPMVNPADRTLYVDDKDPTNTRKNYKDDFWHAFFMSNHMNQTPDHFIRGIRGRTLWHNEFRSNKLYQSVELGDNVGTQFENILDHVDFPAGFQTNQAGLAPFHGNTCDSCHIRNGSGIPLMPNGKLPEIHVEGDLGMKSDYHVRTSDYTYTNKTYPDQEVPSMKLVFFDLGEPLDPEASLFENLKLCDDDDHTVPLELDLTPLLPPFDGRRFYFNKIMNFFGNSLQLNQNDRKLVYDMGYKDIVDNDGFEVVDKTLRRPVEGTRDAMYRPQRAWIDTSKIKQDDVCSGIRDKPPGVRDSDWPELCRDVSGSKINDAIATGEIGFMHLLGRRLGNTPLIEMMPDAEILRARTNQSTISVPGCISLAPGTRVGRAGGYNYRNCATGERGDGPRDCYIGRWGWIGDRASLEDQVANAAHVEMNISSSDSYNEVHPVPENEEAVVRYDRPLCGPANQMCRGLTANSDITEQEIRDMATYQRWIGIPNRAEYQVSSTKVQEGERIFTDELQCNSCHVIEKIAFDYHDNMLPDEERDHLRKLEISANGDDTDVDYPFVSYLGTDLLMHDMGYLSQVAKAPDFVEIRDRERNGKIKLRYKNYVQYIRTPALKGLRFNRFVTDSNHNTKGAPVPLENNFPPGCDFLLHDGRACDAIEAAYLHDGPAVNSLNMIEKMNALSDEELDQLRAFLYSL
jgi:CxxC motif-containing protein (DUF1111 family)